MRLRSGTFLSGAYEFNRQDNYLPSEYFYCGSIADMAEEKLLTAPEVAERLGISTRRVLALIKDG